MVEEREVCGVCGKAALFPCGARGGPRAVCAYCGSRVWPDDNTVGQPDERIRWLADRQRAEERTAENRRLQERVAADERFMAVLEPDVEDRAEMLASPEYWGQEYRHAYERLSRAGEDDVQRLTVEERLRKAEARLEVMNAALAKAGIRLVETSHQGSVGLHLAVVWDDGRPEEQTAKRAAELEAVLDGAVAVIKPGRKHTATEASTCPLTYQESQSLDWRSLRLGTGLSSIEGTPMVRDLQGQVFAAVGEYVEPVIVPVPRRPSKE